MFTVKPLLLLASAVRPPIDITHFIGDRDGISAAIARFIMDIVDWILGVFGLDNNTTVVTFLYHIQVTYSKPVPQAEDHLQGAHEVHEESKPVSAEDIKKDEERERQ